MALNLARRRLHRAGTPGSEPRPKIHKGCAAHPSQRTSPPLARMVRELPLRTTLQLAGAFKYRQVRELGEDLDQRSQGSGNRVIPGLAGLGSNGTSVAAGMGRPPLTCRSPRRSAATRADSSGLSRHGYGVARAAPGHVRCRVRLWERNGSGDSLASAVRRGQTQRSCPERMPLTCRNGADHLTCRAELSVRDEEAAGSNPATPTK
jgi:hypothetical protein